MSTELTVDIKQQVADAWADPMDLRTDAELATELDISPAALRSLRRDEDFYAGVVDNFRRQLPNMLPQVIKGLITQAKRNTASAKLLLEALGIIEGGGTKVYNFGGGGGQSSGFDFSSLSEVELDRTILAYQRDAYPDDVVVMGGVLAPNWSDGAGVIEANFETLEETDEGDAGERTPREAAEDGI